jgi:competence protein ComEC
LLLITPPLFELIGRVGASDPLLPPRLRFRPSRWLAVPGCYLGDIGVTSFAAWIGSLPFVAYYFNLITPVSTPANLIAVPLCVLVLISNLISLVLAGWFPAAAELFNHAGWFGMECIRVSSQWFAHWPAAYFYIPAPNWFTIGLYYALLIGAMTGWFFRPGFRALKIAGVCAATLIWTWMCWQAAMTTRLSVLTVHGGMAVYSDAPGRAKDILVDTGPSNSVQWVTKNFLRAQGVNQLRVLLLTHGDVHHTGGTEPIIELFRVPKIYTSPVRFRSAAYRSMLERLSALPVSLRPVARSQLLGDWEVLHPDADDRFGKADDGAVVLRAAFGKTRVLLLSDLGRDGQAALVQRNPDLRAEIVVTGLPAAGEPLGDTLLQTTQPRLIIVADSELPFSERAKLALRIRLSKQHAPVLYTSDAGAVTLEFKKDQWQLHAMNGQMLRSRDLPGTKR